MEHKLLVFNCNSADFNGQIHCKFVSSGNAYNINVTYFTTIFFFIMLKVRLLQNDFEICGYS